MYLFVRSRTAKGDQLMGATGFAVDIAAQASSITGIETSAWQVDFGAPMNEFTWTVTVESHADLGVAREKLMANAGYLEAIQTGDEFFEGGTEDHLIDIIATAGNGGHKGGFSSFVRAQCATGKIAEAMGFGLDMMNHVNKVTGRDGLFTRSLYGPWATVGWFSLAASLDEVEAATAALSADPDYIGKVDAGGDLFVPGSGETRLTRRIG